MDSKAKAQATMRDLEDELKIRLAGSSTIDTVRATTDAAGWPCLILSDGGTETAGNPVIGLRMVADDAVSKDIFGNAIKAAAPHTIDLAYELDATNPEPSGLDLALVTAVVAKKSIKMALKALSDGTAVTPANMVSKAADKVVDSLLFPGKLG